LIREFPKKTIKSKDMKQIITHLLHLVNEVPQQIQAFSVEEMTQRPAPGKWSKREILGHLCDSALHNWQRFCLAQQTDGDLRHTRYQQDILVKLNNWQGQATAEIIQLWAGLNAQIVAVLKNLPKEKLQSTIVLPNGEPATLEFLIEDYLVHLEHHLGQVFSEKIEQPTLPGRWKFSIKEALDKLENQAEGKILATLLERKNMYVEIYRPDKFDHQIAHSQDEIYVIISGAGQFLNNGERQPFFTGDLIFVPAGVEHRFEDFTEDFVTWVIFY
jgi:mannose-6-phosphate isomerase-like protein (cupin superfamily)